MSLPLPNQQQQQQQQHYPLKDNVICITGASSGIGVAVAHALYQLGAKVCIGARRLPKLQQVVNDAKSLYPTSPGTMIACECDVTQLESVDTLIQTACTTFQVPVINVMIGCAGVMYFTQMKNAQVDQWDETINVNCRGITNAIGCVLPKWIQQEKEDSSSSSTSSTSTMKKIIAISSDAGVRDFPNLAVYCASKRFVETLFEITRRELIGTGITLHTIQPGDVKGTELILKNTDMEAANSMGVAIGKPVGEGMNRNQLLDPQDVANAVVTILTAPPHVSINSVLIEARDQA